MKRLEYIGKVPVFECKMCGKTAKEKYGLRPHPAVVKLLDQWDQGPRMVCKGCARREVGAKEFIRVG